ncbi:class A beta-lactamase-related serine hydrolase [Nonomuraea longispora]|uniref:Class A beta-lactamase-related serine hydrolase n=1 Tax=Nonomuraea longispora TaxID=1848320 RepID=A0A4R4N9Y7_9ACTN|nr:serine hydrolase domain-containing protein [Nonomuraea longispora]TDC05669.1 class A beta-lactamase-related serine hydrolase [Nonomuraea longispora]
MKVHLIRIWATVLAGAVILTASPATASARPVTPETDLPGLAEMVDRIVSGQLAESRIPGAAVVVVSGGRTVLAKGYGVADVATRRPVDPRRTGFFTGSLAKLFTATAALQLVDAGKLDLRADVNKYLTAFKIEDSYPGRPVTLEHLLTYTAGFDDNVVGLAEADPKDVGSLAGSLADRQPRRVRPPGTRVAYDNYGLALAGHLVEAASGQSFAKYVEQHVLKPLGMNATSLAVPHAATLDAHLAGAYRPSEDGYAAVKGQYGPWAPAGTGPVSTPADMGRFMLAQLSGDPRLGKNVVRRLQEQHYAQDPRIPGMGYTFEQRSHNGHRIVYKDGEVTGHHNVMGLLPEQDLGIYVVYNGDGVGGQAGWNGQSLVKRIIDRYLPAKSASAKAVSGGDVTRYAGTYRSTRTSRTSLMKVSSLFATMGVQANADGTLTTTGLSPDPEKTTQHWTPIGQGLFQERDGQAKIAFDDEGTLSTSMNPSEALEKLAWADEPMPHTILLGLSALVFVLAFLALPVSTLVRVLRRRSRAGARSQPAGARAARLLAWITAALVTVFVGGIAMTMSDPNVVTELTVLYAPRLAALPIVATAGLVLSVLVAGYAVAAWVKGWWGRPGRLGYTALALAGVVFFKIAMTYNLLALPFPTN